MSGLSGMPRLQSGVRSCDPPFYKCLESSAQHTARRWADLGSQEWLLSNWDTRNLAAGDAVGACQRDLPRVNRKLAVWRGCLALVVKLCD